MAGDGQNNRRSSLFGGVGVDTETQQKLNWQVGYATVGQVLEGLGSIKNLSEADGNLINAINVIFGQIGRDVPGEINGVVGELEIFPASTAIADATEELWKEKKSELEIETERPEETVREKEMEARALGKQELEKLLTEYEAHLESKGEKGDIATVLAEKYGVEKSQVAKWMERYREALARSEELVREVELAENTGVSENKAEEIAQDLAEKEIVLVESLKEMGLPEKKAVAVAKATTKSTVAELTETGDKRGAVLERAGKEAIEEAKRERVFAGVDKQTTQRVILEIKEQTERLLVKTKVEVDAHKLAIGFINNLREKGVITAQSPVDENEAIRIAKVRIIEVLGGEIGSLVETRIDTVVGEKGFEETKTGFIQDLIREIEPGNERYETLATSVKELDEAVETVVGRGENREVFEEYRLIKLGERVERTILENDPSVNQEAIAEYRELVIKVFRTSSFRGHEEAVAENLAGEGIDVEGAGYDQAWQEAQVVEHLFKRETNVGKLMESYQRVKSAIPNEAINQISECRAVANVLEPLRDLKVFKAFESAKNITNSLSSPWHLVGSALGKIGASERAMSFLGRIGLQSALPVAQQVTTIMANGGGLSHIVASILTTGKISAEAVGLATAGAGTAATGAVATGAVATGAAAGGGLLATIASGPAAPIVAVVMMAIGKISSLFKKVKKITGKIDEQLRKVNLGLPSIKRFVEDTLGIGGLPGKIISGGIGVVSAIAGVFAVPITISLAPVIIGVVGFMFVYPMLQSGMYSSLAPPQTGFGEEGGYFGEAGEGEILFEGIIPPGCPSGWPVNNGSITQGPATTYSHKGSVAESIDFGVGLGTPIMATHDGGVSCRNGRGYGVFVDLIGSCGGIDFITRYGHLIEGSAMHCGEEVTSGTVIGYANNTGNSTGNHLHYEIVSGALGDIRQFLPAPKGFEIRRGCIGFEDCGSISL